MKGKMQKIIRNWMSWMAFKYKICGNCPFIHCGGGPSNTWIHDYIQQWPTFGTSKPCTFGMPIELGSPKFVTIFAGNFFLFGYNLGSNFSFFCSHGLHGLENLGRWLNLFFVSLVTLNLPPIFDICFRIVGQRIVCGLWSVCGMERLALL